MDVNYGNLNGQAYPKYEDSWHESKLDDKLGENGETPQQFYDRISQYLQKTIQENRGNTIVLCAHSSGIAIMDYILRGKNNWNEHYKEECPKLAIPNISYAYSTSGKPVDLHKHFVDNILLKNPKARKAKKVLGVHGYKSR